MVELADRLGLTAALSEAMAPTRERRRAHDPGVVLRDLAVAIADGGDHVSDLGVLRGQQALFGPVASETTAHRVVKSIDAEALEAIRAARAVALARPGMPAPDPRTLILDIDASLLTAHSEKEGAAGNYKGGFGFHPLLCYLAETGEPLAGDPAARQRRRQHRRRSLRGAGSWRSSSCPRPTSTARSSPAPTSAGAPTPSPRDCRDAGIRFSVGYEVDERVREAILACRSRLGEARSTATGAEREGAQVAELTDRVELSSLARGHAADRPPRAPPSRRPALGLRLRGGYRHTAFITDQEDADIAALELRHRRRARVEDAIRTGKETGMRKLPFAAFAHNQAWLEVSLAAQALLRWTAAALPARASSHSPSPSGCASACCTSPGAWCARAVG